MEAALSTAVFDLYNFGLTQSAHAQLRKRLEYIGLLRKNVHPRRSKEEILKPGFRNDIIQSFKHIQNGCDLSTATQLHKAHCHSIFHVRTTGVSHIALRPRAWQLTMPTIICPSKNVSSASFTAPLLQSQAIRDIQAQLNATTLTVAQGQPSLFEFQSKAQQQNEKQTNQTHALIKAVSEITELVLPMDNL